MKIINVQLYYKLNNSFNHFKSIKDALINTTINEKIFLITNEIRAGNLLNSNLLKFII